METFPRRFSPPKDVNGGSLGSFLPPLPFSSPLPAFHGCLCLFNTRSGKKGFRGIRAGNIFPAVKIEPCSTQCLREEGGREGGIEVGRMLWERTSNLPKGHLRKYWHSTVYIVDYQKTKSQSTKTRFVFAASSALPSDPVLFFSAARLANFLPPLFARGFPPASISSSPPPHPILPFRKSHPSEKQR